MTKKLERERVLLIDEIKRIAQLNGLGKENPPNHKVDDPPQKQTTSELLKDKEFIEYTELCFKNTNGNFPEFSKDLIDTLGEKIIIHLPKLYFNIKNKV